MNFIVNLAFQSSYGVVVETEFIGYKSLRANILPRISPISIL